MHGLGNVPEPHLATGMEFDARCVSCRVKGRPSQQHFVTCRRRRYPGREIDGRPEPIRISPFSRPGIHPDMCHREARPLMGELGDLQAKSDRGVRLTSTHHHGVSDRLYLLGVVQGNEVTNRHDELGGDISRLSVPVGFGESRNPDRSAKRNVGSLIAARLSAKACVSDADRC